VNAISLGSLYALFGLGIALIFSVMRLANFAHGELITAGAYALIVAAGVTLPLRIAIAVIVAVLIALAVERVAFRPLRDADPATLLVASFALSYGLQNLAALIFSTTPRSTNLTSALSKTFQAGSVTVARLDVVTIVVGAALLGGLVLFLARTRTGVEMRAAAENFRMARLLGVRANVVIALAFAISGVLAAAASVLLVAQSGQASATMGTQAVVIGFIAAVVGGLGSLVGAVVGAYALGISSTVLQATLPLSLRPFRDAILFSGVFVLLVLRPQGLIAARSAVTRV
jgi:branched-chain amino acid transport system permease protein